MWDDVRCKTNYGIVFVAVYSNATQDFATTLFVKWRVPILIEKLKTILEEVPTNHVIKVH